MKCLQDIKYDIIDKIREDLYKGGLFFYGNSRDSMSFRERHEGSENTVHMIAEGLNMMYKEKLVSYIKVGDSFILSINPSDKLAQQYLNAYNQNRADAYNAVYAEDQQERGFNIDNSGPNTHELLSPFAAEEESVGVFDKFIQHKKRLRSLVQRRLSDIAKELKNPKTSVEQRTKLNDEKIALKTRLEGDPQKGIRGLNQEVDDLHKNANIDAVGYYVEQDLKRLEALSKSNNALDIKEARGIIEFYDAAGTFQSDIENPFFPQNHIFFFTDDDIQTPDYKLGEEMMNQFKQWRDVAMGFAPAVDLKEKEITTNAFNANAGVQELYGANFNFDQVVHTKEGLKDVDWVSAWAMDVTQGIFSQAAPLAQVMHSYLVDAMEKHLNFSRDYAKRMEGLVDLVGKRLGEIENGKYKLKAFGILGISGVSYDLFLDTTKGGMQTGTLVQRFTKEFVDAHVEQANKFAKAFEKARVADDSVKAAMFNAAFEQNKQWKRANTIMMNPAMLDEIISDPEYAQFADANVTEDQKKEHKKMLVDLLGEKGFQQEVERQKQMLNRYMADRQSYINAQLLAEGVAEAKDLSDQSKFIINQWTYQHHPKMGVLDYNSSKGLFVDKRKINSYMDYNNSIPRAKNAIIKDQAGTFVFEDGGQDTGYYNDRFKVIESDPLLLEFYDLVKEGIEKIVEVAPYELQKQMPAMTLPALMKSTAEFLIDNRNGTLKMVSSGWRRLWDRIRLSFGLIQQSQISYAVKDPITGKYNYKINDQFLQGNQRAVKERSIIEKNKFMQAFNLGVNKKEYLDKINRFTTISLKEMNSSSLAHLAELLGVDITMSEIDAGKIDKIKARLNGDKVEIGKIIRDYSVHTIVQAQSFDLPKLMKHFVNLAQGYAARTEALPVMEIMKAHYDQIKNPKTNNIGKPIWNVPEDAVASEGGRKRAVDQMEDWFQRVMLDNYGIKHWKEFGFRTKVNVDEDTKEVSTKIPLIGKKIYSTEDKKKIKEIDKLLSGNISEEEANRLQAIKDGLGKTRTVSAAIVNFLDMIRTLRLGWNLSSSVTNFAEGYISNMILASGGDLFDPAEIYYGYSIARRSWVKNLTFGLRAHPEAVKARILMDRYSIMLDSKNELQKATVKTNLSKLEALNPYELNARVEYINQMPLMVAMLRTLKIKDDQGNESSIWNAMDTKGNLKPEFRSEDNINNWEKLVNQEYLSFKNRINEAIVRGHGNYDELRGMMLKSNLAGKAGVMFKTWLPMQLYWRFAKEQENIKTGKKIKGRYRSFTPGSGAVFGMGLGFATFGPIGIALGGLGYLGGKFFGVQTELNALQEMVTVTKVLFKKALGMPVNMLTGRNLINSKEDFSKWVGTGNFTELDARNLRGNMAELSITMTTLALMLLVKGMFWDDDDDKESPERQFHNIAVNKLMQLGDQASMYVNPPALWKSTLGDIAPLKFLQDLGEELKNLEQLMEGTDPGGTKTLRQTKKLFVPGLFKDSKLGFGTQAEKQFEPSPFDDWFKSDEVVEAKKEKAKRKNLNEELKEAGYTDQKQRLKILNMELPTSKQLNKKGYTREEWEEENKDWVRPEPEQKEEVEQE